MTDHANDLPPHELAAIDTYFDGDRDFFLNFRASCTQQFKQDIADGDSACAVKDAQALRRTAHSLKSVLQTLGYPEHAVSARDAEMAAHYEPWPVALAGWQDLRQRLIQTFQLGL